MWKEWELPPEDIQSSYFHTEILALTSITEIQQRFYLWFKHNTGLYSKAHAGEKKGSFTKQGYKHFMWDFLYSGKEAL